MRGTVALGLAGLLLVPGLALAANWRVIARGQAAGNHTVAAASGTAMRPTAIQMKVTASPNIHTLTGYTIQCRKGKKTATGFGRSTGQTPITKTVRLPLVRPASCVVVASATLPTTTRMTVTIRAR